MKYCQHRPSKAMALLKMELATSYSPSDNFWLPLYVKFKNQNSGKAGANVVVNRERISLKAVSIYMFGFVGKL